MNENNEVKLFMDDEPKPFARFEVPAKFILDTTKLEDGKHKLKVISRSTDGKEGIREINFVVRNGPAISVVGLNDGDVVDDHVSVTVNAYGSERSDIFIIQGSETPKAIPSWVWVAIISFFGWAIFYLLMYWTSTNY